MFLMPPGESLCTGGPKYVWQRGVQGNSCRVTDGQSLPYFPKKEKHILAVAKKYIPQNL